MKKLLLISACLCLTLSGVAQEEFDDIYYNPKTAKTQTQKQQTKNQPVPGATIYGGESQTYYYYPQSAYQENRDIDEYNRYGGYYQSAVDTIGDAIANSQDFVYTQEIQKYYNPTIVVDNMSVLSDLINNSYGNINIVYDYGYPVFSPWYTRTFPYYGTTWCWNPYWNLGWGYGPGWSWNWGWSWGWGGWYDPWFAWGPSWGWSWGPGWVWNTPGWAYSTPRPGNTTRPGWAHNTRPGTGGGHRNPGVVNGMGSATRPGTAAVSGGGSHGSSSSRPGYVQPGTSYTHRGTMNNNYQTSRPGLDTQKHYQTGNSNLRPTTPTTRPSTATTRPSTSTTRPSTTTNTPPSTTTTARPSNHTTRPSMNTTRSNSSFNTGGSTHRSSGGGFRSGGGTRGGGAGGGMRGGGGGHRR
ncbi:MAG: hypothetical protein NC402_03150 [Prevotella sp.]|nr:hypothetical protein [Prevotella sp.]MCM1075096.1 hypothetical protein [Ruminococcus sp.]